LNFGDLVFEMPSSEPKAVEPPKPAPAADEGMPFMIDFPMGELAEAPAKKAETSGKLDIDFADISLNLDAPVAPAGGDAKDDHWHEVATKLDLAKAYQEMGDAAGAREILDEVVRDGDAQQREAAEKLLQQLSA
jgi:pilus assembly protein FimV